MIKRHSHVVIRGESRRPPDIQRQAPALAYRRTGRFPDEVGSRGEIEFTIELALPLDQLEAEPDGWFTGYNCRIPDRTVRATETPTNWTAVTARAVIAHHLNIQGNTVRADIGPKLANYRQSIFRESTIYTTTYQEPLRAKAQIFFEEQAEFSSEGDRVTIPHFATILWNTGTNVRRIQLNAFEFSDERFHVYSLAPHPINGNVAIGIIAPNTDNFDPVTMHIHPGAVPPGTNRFLDGSSYPAQRAFSFESIDTHIHIRTHA